MSTDRYVRLNNSTTVGDQFVTFCWDRNADGCADELLVKKTVIHWIATAPGRVVSRHKHLDPDGW